MPGQAGPERRAPAFGGSRCGRRAVGRRALDIAGLRGGGGAPADHRIGGAADDHLVLGRQPGPDHPEAFAERPEHNRLRHDLVLGAERQHDLVGLVRGDDRVRHQQRVGFAGVEAQASEHARRQELVLVLEHGAAADRRRTGVERVVEEVDLAAAAPFGFVGQAHLDHRPGILAGPVARIAHPGIAQVIGFRDVEGEVDRRDRDDGRQQRRTRLAAGDQVARIDAAVRDAPGERRAHLGPFEVELGVLQVRLGTLQRPDRTVQVGAALVDVARRDRAVLGQALGALDFILGELDLGLGARDFGAGHVDGQFVRPLIDGKEQVALLDERAVGEMHAVDEAGDAGAHVDLFTGLEATGVLVPVGDALGERVGDLDRRGRRSPLCGGVESRQGGRREDGGEHQTDETAA